MRRKPRIKWDAPTFVRCVASVAEARKAPRLRRGELVHCGDIADAACVCRLARTMLMTDAVRDTPDPPLRGMRAFAPDRLLAAIRAARAPVGYGLRLWLSVCAALYIAFWLQLDQPYWAGTSAAVSCLPQ